MKQVGVLLLSMSIGSALLPFLGVQFRLLAWIDNWGETVAWSIRSGLVLAGVLLMSVGGKPPKEPTAPQ